MKAPMRLAHGDGTIPASPTCIECKRRIDGWLELDPAGNIIDSYGFVWLVDHAMCDGCLMRLYGSDGTETVKTESDIETVMRWMQDAARRRGAK